jgi:hypothetical protein
MANSNYYELDVVEVEPPGLLERLCGRKDKARALQTITNILATQPVFQLYHDEVTKQLRPFKLTQEDLCEELSDLYLKILRHLVGRGPLTAKDRDELDRLATLFKFPPEHTDSLNGSVPGF